MLKLTYHIGWMRNFYSFLAKAERWRTKKIKHLGICVRPSLCIFSFICLGLSKSHFDKSTIFKSKNFHNDFLTLSTSLKVRRMKALCNDWKRWGFRRCKVGVDAKKGKTSPPRSSYCCRVIKITRRLTLSWWQSIPLLVKSTGCLNVSCAHSQSDCWQ